MKALCLRSLFTALFILAGLLKPSPSMAQAPIPVDPVLNLWGWDPTNWDTDLGYTAVAYTNVSSVAIWDAYSAFIDTTNESPAFLQYHTVEPSDSHTNLMMQSGVLFFVYAPNWASGTQGGTGPGDYASLIDIGHSTTNAAYGLFALYINPDGNSLSFSAQSNSGISTNFLSAPISWTSNAFHWIGLTWTSNATGLYVDGVCLTNGSGVTVWPGTNVYTNGLFIGSDDQGYHQERGQISDIWSLSYPSGSDEAGFFTNIYNYYWGPAISAWNSGGAGPDFSGPGGGGLLGSGSTLTTTGGRIYIASMSAAPTNGGTMNVTLGLAGGYTNVLYPIYSSTNAGLPLGGWSLVGQTNTDCYVTITNQPGTGAYYLVEAPLATNGLMSWLRADAGIVLSGINVRTWTDQTSNGNDFGQTSLGGQPSFVTNQINGLPVVRFSQTNTEYLTNLSGFLTNASGAEALALIKAQSDPPAGNAGRGLWSFSTTVQGTFGYPHGDGTIADCFGLSYVTNISFPIQPITNYHVYHVSATTTNWTARINGGIQYTGPGSTFNCRSQTQIGTVDGSSESFAGDIVEVLVYNRTLAASERDAAMTYLSQKYALVTTAPATPASLAASAISSNQIGLTWSASMSSFKTEFIIERKTGSGGTYAQVGEVDNGQSFFDSGLAASTQYYYRVFAANYAGDSLYTSEVNATTSSGTTLPAGDLKLWLMADTGVVYDLTNTVHEWLDQTTNGNNATPPAADTANPPTFQTNQINSLPAVAFSNAGMSLPNFLSTSVESSVEGFAVVKAVYESGGGLWSFGATGNDYLGYPNNGESVVDSFGTANFYANFINTSNSTVAAITNYHIYNVSSQSGSLIARINGSTAFTTNVNTVGFPGSGQTTLGAQGHGGNPFVGNMEEIMIFDRVLTSGERTTVQNYLNGKYGL